MREDVEARREAEADAARLLTVASVRRQRFSWGQATMTREVMMTSSEKLMDASQKLAKLSARAKEAEDHAATARNQARADVEKSASEARAAAEAHAEELRKSAATTGAQISASWNDMQRSWADHVAQVREDIDEKKGQFDAKRAGTRADDAEVDALIAIDYAYATVEEAEYAVLDAISARMEANDLAMTS